MTPQPTVPPLTISQVASMLGTSPANVHNMVKADILPSYVVGCGTVRKKRLVRYADVVAHMQRQQIQREADEVEEEWADAKIKSHRERSRAAARTASTSSTK